MNKKKDNKKKKSTECAEKIPPKKPIRQVIYGNEIKNHPLVVLIA